MRAVLGIAFLVIAASAETDTKEPPKSLPHVDFYNYAFYENEYPSIDENVEKIVNKTLYRAQTSKFRAQRRGNSVDTHSCNTVQSYVPRHLTFITRYDHYQKYTHAYGIPIVSTNRVRDAALKRACYVVRFLLADRPRLRQALYKNHGRLGIMAQNEGTTTIPEHRHLGSWWDSRARGLGGTLAIPISTGGEENLLCLRGDRYSREDIFLHEFSHGIQEVAIRGGGIPGYFRRLTTAYNSAKYRGLWRNTYSMSTVQEYFAEGVQSYFQVNDYAPSPNGVHGPINTRSKLRTYDPTLYRLIQEVFPCGNIIHDRCKKGTPGSFRMNCDGSKPVVTVAPTQTPSGGRTTTTKKPLGGRCKDDNRWCSSWARRGECTKNPTWMSKNCQKSCNTCRPTPVTVRPPQKCENNKKYNKYCSPWQRRGYCKSTSKWNKFMKNHCSKSCSFC